MRLLPHKKSYSLIYLLLSTAVTLLFLWLFFRDMGWHAIASLPSKTQWHYLVAAGFLLVPGFLLRAWRWHQLLKNHGSHVTLRNCLAPILSAFAINNILPFRLGDIARITLFKRILIAEPATITTTLLLERLLDFFSLILIFFIGLGAMPLMASGPFFSYILSVACVVTAGTLVVIAMKQKISRSLRSLSAHANIPNQVRLIVQFIDDVITGLFFHGNPRALCKLFVTSIAIWLTEIAMFWCVGRALAIALNPQGSALIMSISTFSTLLPSTPGYIGTFHYLCRMALELIGIETISAIQYAILIHAIIVIPVTLVGSAIFIHYLGMHTIPALRKMLKDRIGS
ncbi:MAG: flippase-like domain-containing protein [Gammaproteobacteria bacterium]|nr:MAG: flippase-like domain-containing protein [Gammaproteobacteria bacterium]